jgi:hypothetical protein
MASKSKNCTTNMPPEFKAVYATFRLDASARRNLKMLGLAQSQQYGLSPSHFSAIHPVLLMISIDSPISQSVGCRKRIRDRAWSE